MIKQLEDGRFYVSVVCPDGIRRWRIYPTLDTAQFFEAIGLAGWFDGIQPKGQRKRKTYPATAI